MEVLAVLIFAEGTGLTTTFAVAELEQFPDDTITEYDVFPAGATMMEEAVAPVFQAYVNPPDAVSVADWPAQMVLFPETTAIGGAAAFTVITSVSVQPLAFVTVTV